MRYKHPFFTLDTERKIIYHQSGTETLLSGRAYDFLEFLCKSGSDKIAVSDIEEAIDPDGEKPISDANFRQITTKIANALGKDIFGYKEGRYWIVGDVAAMERETDFLEKEELRKKMQRTSYFINKRKILILLFSVSVISISYLFYNFFRERYLFHSEYVDEMILVEEGEFIMGSNEQEIEQAVEVCKKEEGGYCLIDDYQTEYPKQSIFVKAFEIDKREVSNAEYAMFIEKTKASLPDFWSNNDLNQANQPVVGVSWYDARDYCGWVNKRLPTEQEWEKAARGEVGNVWPWGNAWNDQFSNHGMGGEPGYDEGDGYKFSAPIGIATDVSPYGILNMSGNVYEWVNADFKAYPNNDKYLHDDYNSGVIYKVFRGGSYYYTAADSRAAVRNAERPTFKDDDIGFRCAKDV